MFIIIQLTQFWYKHTICLHILHVSAYCGHHQVHRAFRITFLCAILSYICQCLYVRSVLYWYVFLCNALMKCIKNNNLNF
jgi:hypothetical protein